MTEDEDLIRRAVDVARASTCGDEYEAVWPLLSRVAARATTAIDLGAALLGRPDPIDRAVGCDLLGLVAEGDAEGVKEGAITALLAFAERESRQEARDPDVQWSIACALGRTDDPRALPGLLGLAGHPDSDVRDQVASGLPSVLSIDDPDPAGLSALIALTRDPDPDVRDWATFGLGSVLEADSPEIRAALWDRVGDEHADTREEGICGLARRRDPRSVPLMVELLSAEDGAHFLVFDAAEKLAAPELVPCLEIYDKDASGVAEALAACRNGAASQVS